MLNNAKPLFLRLVPHSLSVHVVAGSWLAGLLHPELDVCPVPGWQAAGHKVLQVPELDVNLLHQAGRQQGIQAGR
jgi:hypothetical protein